MNPVKENLFDVVITPLRLRKTPILIKYHKFLQEIMEGSKTKFIIAGGMVRDFLKEDHYSNSKDIDVFISTKLTDLRLNKLKKYGTYTVKDTEYAGFFVINFKFNDGMGIAFGLPSHTPIQFIYNNDTGDPTQFDDLESFALFTIRNFDWDINACAFDGVSIIRLKMVGGYTDVMYLVNPKYNPLTALYRGIKFKDRFQKTLDRNSMRLLCQKIAELED